LQLAQKVFGPPIVYDVVASLDNNGAPFATVHVGVRTTLLLAFYAPWRTEALGLMGIALLTAILAALLLSNLALRPMEKISRQLDRLDFRRRGGWRGNRYSNWHESQHCSHQVKARAQAGHRRPGSPTKSSASASACAMSRRSSPP